MSTGNLKRYQNMTVYVESIVVGGNTLSGTELGYVDGITAGTITASKAAVVDSNRDLGVAVATSIRNLVVTNLDAGASATAGTVDIFPTTASKGKIQIAAADSTGNTTTTITNAAQSAAGIMTIPDTNGNASFVMTAANQTIGGAKTFSTMPIWPTATVAAAGNDQTNAAAITTGFTLVSGTDGTKGVILPTAAAGLVCVVKNIDAANAILKIWPFNGDGINALTVTTGSFSIAAKTSVMLIAYDATTWYSTPLLPS